MPSRQSEYDIGVVADMTGLKIETIRYYETIDVIATPNRGDNRYRLYANKHIERQICAFMPPFVSWRAVLAICAG